MAAPAATAPPTGQQVTFDKYGGPLKLSPFELKQLLKPNQLLIKVHAASLNPIDYKRVAGLARMFIKDDFPRAGVCFDVAGVVVQSQSADFAVGQRVCCRSHHSGTLADYCVVDADVTAALPDDVSFVAGAAVGLAGQTALLALRLGELREGQSVLISGGAGGVGSYAVQLAKHVFKAGRVVTSCSTSKVDFCKSLGADECLDYTKDKYTSLHRGGEFDVILDCVGVAQELCSAKLIRKGGKIVSIASLPDSGVFERAGMPSGVLVRGVLHLLSTRLRWTASPGEYLGFLLQPTGAAQAELVRWLQTGQIRSVIDTEYRGLDQFQLAFDKLKQGRVQGKLVVCPSQEQQ